MGMLSRFKDIMASRVGDVFDKADQPEKVVRETLRTLTLDLGKVKSETASLLEEEKRIKRALNECRSNRDKMERYARRALEGGHEDDARAYLEKKAALTAQVSELETSYKQVSAQAVQMKQMQDKLISDIGELEARSYTLKAKMTAAKVKGEIGATHTVFEQADRALFEAEALAELRSDPLDAIEEQPETGKPEVDIDADLEALKERMKKN